MLGALRIFRKDLFELLDGARGILLVFVLPSVLLLLVGQIQTQTPPLHMLVAGEPSATRVLEAGIDRVAGFFGRNRASQEQNP